MANKCANNIIKHIIPNTPSKVGVLQSITFYNIPNEARSAVLANPCVHSKNLFCYREISINKISYTEWKTYINSCFFIMVSNKWNKCYICKVQFADAQKCYYHSEVFSSPYNMILGSVFINFG